MKFLLPNYSCLQNPWLGDYRPPDPRSVCPLSSTEFVEPPEQNFWVHHFWELFSSNTEELNPQSYRRENLKSRELIIGREY